ncbi:MAG TPA: hypothetical protein DD670_06705 [Planctomycetaceae bacterium]|nr:hypothetical protein [Planctomycetaceae bacterium]
MGLTLRKGVWRGIWAIIGATAVGCLYCAIRSVETAPFGLIVSPFVGTSVVLFILLEVVCSGRLPKYLGFFIPTIIVVGACYYGVWSLRSEAARRGISDGGDDLLVYFVECYVVSLCFAIAFLLMGWRRKNQGDDQPSGVNGV